ncbi:hypothetical protein I6I99_04915 [Sphingobacterium multivorum]|nr:PKD-like family lipoprotein [Sphingobacterium multivorum]QQT31912.1 hypothetical protein I6I99_04915 [Sphingobacterium multivorum]
MEIRLKFIISLASIVLIWSGCSKDKGNYTYSTLDELQISTDMEQVDPTVFITADSIEIQQNDSLKVQLKVLKPSGKEKQLAYKWYLTQYEQSGINPSIYVIDSTAVLRTKIRVTPNLYRLVAEVKDLTTGVSYSKVFALNVATAEWGGEGWLVLQEATEGADLSMITTRDGSNKGQVYHDLYSSTNGHQLPKGTFKVNVIDYATNLRAQKISFLYPGGALQVRSTDYADSSRSDSWFLGAQEHMNIQLNGSAGGSGTGFEYMVADNRIAYRQFAGVASLAKPPLFFPPFEGLTVAPFVINAAGSDQYYTLFDLESKGFKLFNASNSVLSSIGKYAAAASNLDPEKGQGFDLTAIGDNLVYAENSQPINLASNIYWNCFFRDNQSSKTYVLQFPRSLSYANNFTTGRYQLLEANCPGINTATLFANPTFLPMPGGVFYYVNGNKIYTCQLKPLAGSSAKADLSFPEGTIIKALKIFKSGYTTANITALAVPEGKVLVVATDETASGKGHKVYFFQLDAQTGAIKGSPANPADVYEGFHKISDISFKKALGR